MQDTSPDTALTIFTIGHSNHALDVFLGLLLEHRIQVVADVRSSPYSGYASQFDRETIQGSLRAAGLEYLFLGDLLGGRPEDHQFYDPQGRVLYDRLAQSERFQAGIGRLLRGLAGARMAILCGEEDPTDCHRRRLVGRVLAGRGICVLHIRGDGRIETEDELARREEFRRTKGQLSLFDTREPDEWKSTRSVSPKRPQPSSSGS
jgi:uncharacterized protein (DUF488 family)